MLDQMRKLIVRVRLRLLRPCRPIDIAALTALGTAVFAIVLNLVSRFPFLKSLLRLEENLPDAVVLFAAIIIVLLYVFRNEVREDQKRILERLQGADFRVFVSSDEQVFYIATKINNAKESICDISWVDYWGAHRTSPERESADRAFDDAIVRFATHKPYREIFVFDSEATLNRRFRVEKLRLELLTQTTAITVPTYES
jgi:hypothetical protein